MADNFRTGDDMASSISVALQVRISLSQEY